MNPAPGTHSDLPPGLDPVFVRIHQASLSLLDTRANDIHARISCQYVVAMLPREGGDPRVAVPAVLLHDLGWHEIPEEEQRRAYGPGSSDAELNRLHERAGARLAREILEGLAYPPALTAEICRIIATHDSRPEAATVEEALVKDADKVWRVSRLGFPVTLRMLGNLSPQELHDFISVRVPRWFLTASGRALVEHELAARRREYGLDPAPDIPPPPGYGIGDVEEYA
ncbi:MAG: hypothetical protein Kow00122_14530 [Thermoleophilia bacterium]